MFAADGVQGGSASTGKSGQSQGSSGAGKEFAKAVETQRETTTQEHNQGDTAPDTAPNNVTLTTVRSGGTDLVEDTAAQVADGAGDEDRPAADGTNGKTEHVVSDGETLDSIAEDHGQTVDDVLLANPEMTETTVLEEGDVVALYDETRLEIAREIATTNDPERLNQLVMDEILYATEHSSTPGDLLPAAQQDILARREGDAQFASVVAERGAAATVLWQNQGRTHEVMDPLFELAAQGDSAALQQQIVGILDAVATGTPTPEAIEGQANILAVYGPQDPVFLEALDAAETYFNTGRPQEVADQVAAIYEEQGSLGAADYLREHTAFGNADPLTAARILDAAQPTIERIIGTIHDVPEHSIPIFSDLSAAVDNASISGDAATASIANMAHLLNEQKFWMVAPAIIDGDGVVLSLEMLAQGDGHFELDSAIQTGIEGLRERVGESVAEFAETAYPITGPAASWGGLVADTDATFEAMLDTVGPDGTTLRAELEADTARLSEDGRQMMRLILAMEDYAPRLTQHPEIVALGTAPAEGTDPAIELVLGSQGAFMEAVREANMRGLESGIVLNPYAFVSPGSFFTRMLGNTGRSTAIALYGRTPPDFGTRSGIGLGLTFWRMGTYAVGFGANAGGASWRNQVLTGLNAGGILLEGAQALAGLYTRNQGLTFLTQAELRTLTPFERQMALAASADQVWNEAAGRWAAAEGASSVLQSFARWHLRGFGVFNLLSGVQYLADGKPIPGIASIAAGSGTLVAVEAQALSRLFGIAASRIALGANVVTLIASGVLVANAIHEQHVKEGEIEAAQVAYLEAAGVDPETARALVDIQDGPLPAPALQALSDYLNLAPGELLSALESADPADVGAFRYWLLQTLPTDENGQFAATSPDLGGPLAGSLEGVLARLEYFNIVLPDHRSEPPQN